MAAPHIAGIVALLEQADPALTPAQIEDVLEDTAHKFTTGASYVFDPNNPDDPSTPDKGHGLADARAAVLEVLGLPTDVGLDEIDRSIAFTSPLDGDVVGPEFQAAGTAISRTGGAPGSLSTEIANEPGSDAEIASADLQQVVVSEPSPGSVRVLFTVRDTSNPTDRPHAFELFHSLNGKPARVSVNWVPSTNALSCDQTVINAEGLTESAPLDGCLAERPSPNSFTLTYPLSSVLGDGVPVRGAHMFDVWASAFVTANVDQAPGGPGALVSAPRRGPPHVFVGSPLPGSDVAGDVSLSVDGAAPTAATSGAGTFAWTSDVGPLDPGAHTLTASLESSGVTIAETVAFTVLANRPPLASGDLAEAESGETITIPVLGNDDDPDGDTLTLSDVQSPTDAGGTAATSDGAVVYTAPVDFDGADHFTYEIDDGHGHTSQGDVTVLVTDPADPPVDPGPDPDDACGVLVGREFHLTSDLVGCTRDGLIVLTDGATIHLDGHSIFGVGEPGSAGIRVNGNDDVRIIGPGTIAGFGDGIRATASARLRVDRVEVRDNLGNGIVVQGRSPRIRRVIANYNGANGIWLLARSKRKARILLTDNSAIGNVGYGIATGGGKRAKISGNTASGNNGFGPQCRPVRICS